MKRLLARAFLLISLASCSLDALDPSGKACPCPEPEYACDATTQTCMRAAGAGSGAATSSSAAGENPATTGAGGTAGGMCADVCGTPDCGTCPTSKVVQVEAFDIDAYEVTLAEYQAFLDVKPDPANQPSQCNWNTSFEPSHDGDCAGSSLDPVMFPKRPIVCIDWCDAHAYCAWAGRHLCGRIGGGTLLESMAADPTKSEWTAACSKGGTQDFPYPGAFQPTTCNTRDSGFGAFPQDVGLASDCEGGYPGLFDMSGNTEEWEDACGSGSDPDQTADDGCPLRGGAFWTMENQSGCYGLDLAPPRNTTPNDAGIRCCGG